LFCSLELGAGGGLVGLAVALGCGVESRLMLTDQDEMLELMNHNIKLNKVEDKATAFVLNWYVLDHLEQIDVETRNAAKRSAKC
jgi:tRNA1(Val) A37 N6-methylase TrmN6